jgi:hypothetical protein
MSHHEHVFKITGDLAGSRHLRNSVESCSRISSYYLHFIHYSQFVKSPDAMI